MTPLRQRMIEDMKIRNFSVHTIAQYVSRIAHFARHFGRSPEQLGLEEIRAYQLHLVQQKVSWGVLSHSVSALRFLYLITLQKDWNIRRIPYPHKEVKLPEVPTRDEVARFLDAITNIKHRALLTACYAAGLRVSEATHLRVKDIDGDRKLIHVHLGKGKKDRMVPLPDKLLVLLREYWRVARPTDWLFPVRKTGRPISSRSAQRICVRAQKRAGIKRKIRCHVLRAAFATHLLEAGVNVRSIQILMGHRNLTTTGGYLRVAKTEALTTTSPLDLPLQAG
jgi:integrase/recombinase XerD